MERFFRADSTVVASFYAPITYGPAPVLVLQEDREGNQVSRPGLAGQGHTVTAHLARWGIAEVLQHTVSHDCCVL